MSLRTTAALPETVPRIRLPPDARGPVQEAAVLGTAVGVGVGVGLGFPAGIGGGEVSAGVFGDGDLDAWDGMLKLHPASRTAAAPAATDLVQTVIGGTAPKSYPKVGLGGPTDRRRHR
jgi:hypothetical protein